MQIIKRTPLKRSSTLLALVLLTALCAVTVVLAANPGDLDETFDGDGIAITNFSGQDNVGLGLATQSNLKTVVVGKVTSGSSDTLSMVRYNEDGSLDASFGTGGKVTSNLMDVGEDVAVQPDGKLVVAGHKQVGGVSQFAVARFNSNGSADTSFGTDGVTLTPIGSNAQTTSIYLQFDGKIIAAGWSDNASRDFALARYNEDGTLDTTFDGDGVVETDFPEGLEDRIDGVAAQLDGKIVVAGTTKRDRSADDYDFALARYNVDGSLDTSFGIAGTGLIVESVRVYSITGFDLDDGASSVTLQSDGKVVAAGYSAASTATYTLAVVRYNPDGTLDDTFSEDGIFIQNVGDGRQTARGVSIQTDGKSVVGISVENLEGSLSTNEGFVVARLRLDGSSLDGPDFANATGYEVIAIPNAENQGAEGIALQRDGKIVTTGFAEYADGSVRTATLRLISGAPLLAVDPGSLVYEVLSGGERIQSKQFSVSGYGSADPDDEIRWSVVSDEGWLTLDQSNGVGDTALTATIDTTGFENGEYTARIIVFAGSATRQELSVTVNITDQAKLYLPITVR